MKIQYWFTSESDYGLHFPLQKTNLKGGWSSKALISTAITLAIAFGQII